MSGISAIAESHSFNISAQAPPFAGQQLQPGALTADHVGGKNGGKPAFQALSPLPRRLANKGGRIHAVGVHRHACF